LFIWILKCKRTIGNQVIRNVWVFLTNCVLFYFL
jgi:hypothetical protein